MGWNLLTAVEQEDHGDEVIPMILYRANAGITHSAYVGRGDVIDFPCGIAMEVMSIRHRFSNPMSGRAPVSEAYLRVERGALTDSEIELLKTDGWQEVAPDGSS